MDRNEVFEKVKAIVAKTFAADPTAICEQSSADDIDGWDSLAHATLMMRLEKTFNVDIDPEAASEAHNLGVLTDIIHAKVGQA